MGSKMGAEIGKIWTGQLRHIYDLVNKSRHKIIYGFVNLPRRSPANPFPKIICGFLPVDHR